MFKIMNNAAPNYLIHLIPKRQQKCNYQKHLGVTLDSNLNFNTHIDQKIKKCNKLIGLLKRLSVNLPRNALLTIYKSFIRPHLDYGDI